MIDYKRNRLKLIQSLLILFVWILLLAIPVLFNTSQNSQSGTDWQKIFRIWEEYSLLFVAFLINHFILVPYFFLKDRRGLYFILFGILLLALTGALILFHRLGAPEILNPGNQLPGRPGFREPFPGRPLPGGPGRQPFVPGYANMLVISFLVLGFDTGLTFSIKWLESQQKQVELEKENTQNKLAFLKTQVSPHFFLNTLNNIHALIDINTIEAKDAVVKLSRLMSYLLYDSRAEKIALKKESDFVRNYVELMRLRFSGKVDINLEIPENLPEVEIPPLLFISFIENAFKHGVSYKKPSYINISFDWDKTYLFFEISNSNHAKAEREEKSGIGIENSLKRLELLYGSSHILQVKNEKEFSVKLGIPL